MFFETALDSFEKSLQQMMHGLKLVAYLDADLMLPWIVVACDIAVIALSIGALGLLAHRALSGSHRKLFQKLSNLELYFLDFVCDITLNLPLHSL